MRLDLYKFCLRACWIPLASARQHPSMNCRYTNDTLSMVLIACYKMRRFFCCLQSKRTPRQPWFRLWRAQKNQEIGLPTQNARLIELHGSIFNLRSNAFVDSIFWLKDEIEWTTGRHRQRNFSYLFATTEIEVLSTLSIFLLTFTANENWARAKIHKLFVERSFCSAISILLSVSCATSRLDAFAGGFVWEIQTVDIICRASVAFMVAWKMFKM